MPGRRPIASFYSEPKYSAWQKDAAKALKGVPAVTFEGPCSVTILVSVTRPKTSKLPAPKPDVDNYAKGVLDAITKDGRFWLDDSQVVTLSVAKRWVEGPSHINVSIVKDL